MKKYLLYVHLPTWLTVLAVFAVALVVTTKHAKGDDEIVPGPTEYAAMERGQTCAIVRKLIVQAQKQIQASNEEIVKSRNTLKTKRAELDKCRQEKGIGTLRNPDNAALAAELCPDQYSRWLMPGYGRHLGEEDLRASRDTLRLLTWHLDLNCRSLPTPTRKVASKDRS